LYFNHFIGKNSLLFDKFIALRLPLFLLQLDKRNDLWALDSDDSGQNKYGILLIERHKQLTRQVDKNGKKKTHNLYLCIF
jgi:hypothetical protein